MKTFAIAVLVTVLWLTCGFYAAGKWYTEWSVRFPIIHQTPHERDREANQAMLVNLPFGPVALLFETPYPYTPNWYDAPMIVPAMPAYNYDLPEGR